MIIPIREQYFDPGSEDIDPSLQAKAMSKASSEGQATESSDADSFECYDPMACAKATKAPGAHKSRRRDSCRSFPETTPGFKRL